MGAAIACILLSIAFGVGGYLFGSHFQIKVQKRIRVERIDDQGDENEES